MARLNSSVLPVLDESTITKLHSRNIFTVYDFMLQTCDELMKKTGLSFKEVEDLRESIFKKFGGEVVNPFELYKKENETIISTGIKNLDNLLSGGLHCGQIYEVCGYSSAGKSQLCHWIAMNATLNDSTEVYYVDTSRNFCVTRIQMMLDAKQCNNVVIGKVMSSIRVYQIHKINDLIAIFHHLAKMPKDNLQQAASLKKLVIIDSLTILFSLISTMEMNSTLSNLASACRYFVNNFSAAVLIINTVRLEQGVRLLSDNDKNFINNMRPSLGNYWQYVPNVRLYINHVENNRREIFVWKSCQLENKKNCFIEIKDEGVFESSN